MYDHMISGDCGQTLIGQEQLELSALELDLLLYLTFYIL